jgi:hypothetical protein
MNEFTQELIAKLQSEIAERQDVFNFLKNKDSAGRMVVPARKPVPWRLPRKWTPQQRRKYMATLKKQQATKKAKAA